MISTDTRNARLATLTGRVLTGAAFVATATATLVPIWRGEGWPLGHDGTSFAQRTLVYARHMATFDLLPVWSSSDAAGFGSPMPLMYHKLFYLVAAPLSMILPTTKAADIVTVIAALVVGAAGMYRLVRALSASRLAATAAGCSLIVANYTVTNWLVRGALAELTAAMLVPWLLHGFVVAIARGRLSTGVGVWLALLWLSHSVLAFFAGLLLAFTYLLLAVSRRAPWSTIDPRTAWKPVLAFALITLPYVVAMALVGSRYDLGRFHSWPLSPRYQFRALQDYFWDTHWHFGRTMAGLTYQIDLAMIALLFAGLLCLAIVIRSAHTADQTRQASMRAVATDIAPLLILVLACVLLQRGSMQWFYDYVPGAVFIQFPWRLLALLTPALIAAAFVSADRTLPHDLRLLAISASAAWMIAGSGAFVAVVDPWVPIDPVKLAGNFSGFREYEPIDAPPLADLQSRIAARWQAEGCSVIRQTPGEEVVVDRFNVECARAGVLPLPVYASRFHDVEVSTFARSQPCLAVPDIPAVCGATLPAGISVVSVHMPTLARVLARAMGDGR